MAESARYELYYWPEIPGRGEFVRLALEEAGADYVDVARLPEAEGGGVAALERLLNDERLAVPPFAPPFLKAGSLVIAQTSLILRFLGERHGLAPEGEVERLAVEQIQLTVADLVVETHDCHHPLGAALYYEDQKSESLTRSKLFIEQRLPKFLPYFETILSRNRASHGEYLVGSALTYADLSLFQLVGGLRYAFPKAMKRLEPELPKLSAHCDRVAARPRIASYLASKRRLPFNQYGIFRHYPELDH
jgi:glutathione S-transferase